MTPVVQLDRVTVRYGRQQALRDVSATFPSGAVGLLGPNGAGKSTMLRALLGFVVPDQGQMRVLDLEPASVIKRMKDKGFARAVSRDDLRRGAEELNLPLDAHVANVIASLREQAEALGLRGTL